MENELGTSNITLIFVALQEKGPCSCHEFGFTGTKLNLTTLVKKEQQSMNLLL